METPSSLSGGLHPWYLIQCKPRKESYTAQILNMVLGLPVFLPEIRIHLRKEIRQEPFFPGYIFARVDLQHVTRSRINTCPGVIRLVEFGGEPQAVPQQVIETISQHLHQLHTCNDHPSLHFSPGDIVRMKHGPLQDLEMIFVGSTTGAKRVSVLLNILGRLKEVHMDADKLEKVASAENVASTPILQTNCRPRRKRYTRGKGRKVVHSSPREL